MSKIPSKKHSKAELSRIKAQGAMQMNNSLVVNTYNKQLASKFTIALGYALPFITILWWVVKKRQTQDSAANFEMLDFFVMAIPLILALLIALWIAVKRVLSRHNSAFISIFCILCCFPIASVVNSSELLQADLMALIGKEISVEEDHLIAKEKEGAESTLLNNRMTEEERLELLEYEKNLKLENADYIREKASKEALKKAREELGIE